MIELKCCPFCGSDDVMLISFPAPVHCYVLCRCCHAEGLHTTSKDDAVQVWNNISRDSTPRRISAIKPCPFCGSTFVRTSKDSHGYWTVECWEIGCRASYGNHKYPHTTERDAIDGWNRRVKG